jgi:L-ascorbate metabolism protein UlaG (beta-lactamase superfamily)
MRIPLPVPVLMVLLLTLVTRIPPAHAELTARWLGVAGIAITDGTSTLLFDPVFTKPTLRHWLLNAELKSDRARVEEGLRAAAVQRADAVFASHCHFDHASDVGVVSEKTGAMVYGGPSLRKITLSDTGVRAKFSGIRDGEAFQVGRFRIIPYRREHSPILRAIDWKFLPGAVKDDFHYEFYGFREGETWGYRVEHPEGNLLIDQSSQLWPGVSGYAGKTDTHFVGVANAASFENLLDENIRKINAPRVIPLHFDLFFLQSEALERQLLPGIKLDQFSIRLNGVPGKNFLVPSKFEPIPIGRLVP